VKYSSSSSRKNLATPLHFTASPWNAPKLGDDPSAASHFQKLLETNPGYVAGYFQFGQFLSRVGRLDEARKLLSDGIVAAQKAGDAHARDEMQAALNSLR